MNHDDATAAPIYQVDVSITFFVSGYAADDGSPFDALGYIRDVLREHIPELSDSDLPEATITALHFRPVPEGAAT